jgi:hypothetical protein
MMHRLVNVKIIRVVILYDSNKEFEMHFSSVLSVSQHVLCESWQTYLGMLYLTDGDGTVRRLASA